MLPGIRGAGVLNPRQSSLVRNSNPLSATDSFWHDQAEPIGNTAVEERQALPPAPAAVDPFDQMALTGSEIGWLLSRPQDADATAPQDRRSVSVIPQSRADNLYIEKGSLPPGASYEKAREAFSEFDPARWNTDDEDQRLNNCYAYTFDTLQTERRKKPQPGELAGLPALRPEQYTCRALRERIALDHPGVLFTQDIQDPCPFGHYRAWFGLDLQHPRPDYHFFVQHRDGTWSHKPGSEPVTRHDDRGRVITDPRSADYNFQPGYNYNTNCGFICIPRH